MIDYISTYKAKIASMGIDFEADKSRINAELRVMMFEMYLKSNWTKLTTIPREIFIPTNRGETSHLKKN